MCKNFICNFCFKEEKCYIVLYRSLILQNKFQHRTIHTIIMDDLPAIQNGIELENLMKIFGYPLSYFEDSKGQSFWGKHLNLFHTQQITAHECMIFTLFIQLMSPSRLLFAFLLFCLLVGGG